jgi:hypothetical protein
MVVGTNLWLWEQKPLVVGTKRHMIGEQKKMVVEQKCMLMEQIYGCSNKNLWLW